VWIFMTNYLANEEAQNMFSAKMADETNPRVTMELGLTSQ